MDIWWQTIYVRASFWDAGEEWLRKTNRTFLAIQSWVAWRAVASVFASFWTGDSISDSNRTSDFISISDSDCTSAPLLDAGAAVSEDVAGPFGASDLCLACVALVAVGTGAVGQALAGVQAPPTVETERRGASPSATGSLNIPHQIQRAPVI